MAKKRPRRAPDVSKGPRAVQASKLTDRRPPKRGGKSGSPLATGNAKAKPTVLNKSTSSGVPTGTSLSGKPIGPAVDPSKIPSTETPRAKKPPIAEPETKPRKLNARELRERQTRFNDTFRRKRRLEKEKKRVTADLSSEIKDLADECDRLSDELERGYEQIRQGELPFEAAEVEAGKTTPSMPTAAAENALAQVAAAAGEQPTKGNGADGQEPPPKIDQTKADAVRMAAATSGAQDDIAEAVRREQHANP